MIHDGNHPGLIFNHQIEYPNDRNRQALKPEGKRLLNAKHPAVFLRHLLVKYSQESLALCKQRFSAAAFLEGYLAGFLGNALPALLECSHERIHGHNDALARTGIVFSQAGVDGGTEHQSLRIGLRRCLIHLGKTVGQAALDILIDAGNR